MPSADGYDGALAAANRHARRYLASLTERPVREQATASELRGLLDCELPEAGEEPAGVVEEIAHAALHGELRVLGGVRVDLRMAGSRDVSGSAPISSVSLKVKRKLSSLMGGT